MAEGRVVRPLAGAIVVAVALLVVLAGLSLVAGPAVDSPAGADVDGQSPRQFQPAVVNPPTDAETGELDFAEGDARILVDATHDNRVSMTDLDPVINAAFEAGHEVDVAEAFGPDLDERLEGYDGLLIVDPEDPFTDEEVEAIREFTEEGGHVVVLAEPTQVTGGGLGLFSAGPSVVSFGANNLSEVYGVRIGAEPLYNVETNDNNFMSIYVEPTGTDPLVDGVERLQFDTGGYVVLGADAEAEPVAAHLDGAHTLDSRRPVDAPAVVRTENFVFVADASFIKPSERYDVDNEAFLANLVDFLAEGTAPG